jgi:hypothetical protein
MKNYKLSILLLLVVSLGNFTCGRQYDSYYNNSSKNGSLSRFIVVNNYLYIVDRSSLQSYDLSNNGQPTFSAITNVGAEIETIFFNDNKLYIGSNSAMYLYGLNNPASPNLIGQFNYTRIGRDPIVVQDSMAYSTLRNFNGNNSGGVLNTFNIKNPSNIINTNSQGLANPYGLATNQSALYVCDGTGGLRIYSKNIVTSPALANTINNGETYYDAIVEGNILVCYIKGGLNFFNISSPLNPTLLYTVKN